MKKTLSMLVILATMVFAISCKKNNTAKPDTNTTTKKKYLTQSIQIFESVPYLTTYSYDLQKRLVDVKQNTKTGPVETSYSWDAKSRVAEIEVITTSGGSSYRTVTSYTYQEDKSTAHANIKNFKDQDLTKEQNTDYVLDGTRVKEIHFDTGNVVTYTYDASGNLVKIQSNQDYTSTITYTDKKSMGIRFIPPGIDNTGSSYLQSKTVSVTGQSTMTTIYTYTFDAKGFVITVVADQDADDHNDTKTTYAYDTDGYVTAVSLEYPAAPIATTKSSYTWTAL